VSLMNRPLDLFPLDTLFGEAKKVSIFPTKKRLSDK
jgi:hypothetical protein